MKENGKLAVDTNAVIAYREGVPEVCSFIEGADIILLPAIVLGELLYGAANSARPQENEQAVRKFLEQCIVIPPCLGAEEVKPHQPVPQHIPQRLFQLGNRLFFAGSQIFHGDPAFLMEAVGIARGNAITVARSRSSQACSSHLRPSSRRLFLILDYPFCQDFSQKRLIL